MLTALLAVPGFTTACNNATYGGKIGYDESICGSFNPEKIVNLQSASGGSGGVEYAWYYNTSNNSFPTGGGNGWVKISGAESSTYDPGTITQTRYYIRVARCSYCNDYVVKSNVVKKEVKTALSANCTTQPVNCSGPNTGSCNVTCSGGGGSHNYSWNTGWNQSYYGNCHSGQYTCTVTSSNGCTATCTGTVSSSVNVTASITCGSITCFGGTTGPVTATASGGTAPYTYKWSTGATGYQLTSVTAGTYKVTATDKNGCTGSAQITVSQPSQVSVTLAGQNTCPGSNKGKATATATGGVGSYQYKWSTTNTWGSGNSISNLATGTYKVTVKDGNGCTASASVSISTINITATCSSQPVTCAGSNTGSCNVTSNYGQYYHWSNGCQTQYNGNCGPGNYTVTITDASGCTITCSTNVSSPVDVDAYVACDNHVSCFGGNDGQATASASGGTSPYTYLWSNGATTKTIYNLIAGTYKVTVTDKNGCTGSAQVTVNQPQPFYLSCNSTNASPYGASNGKAAVTISGGVAPYTYLWSNGATTATLNNVPAGVYSVTVTDARGCKAEKECYVQHFNDCTGFRTQTIGGWGSPPNGGNPGAYLHANFAGAFPNGLTVGCTNKLKLTTAQAVTDFLPSGGTAAALPAGTLTNPTSSSYKNTFASQVVALKISLTFDATYANFGLSTTLLKDLYIVSGPFAGKTVEFAFNEAEKVLGGCASSYSISDLNTAITKINENFVDGTITGAYLTCCPSLTVNVTQTPVKCNGGNTGTATATPSTPGNYTYKWNTGATTQTITGLSAGVYKVTVKEGNLCSATGQVTVTEPNSLTVSATVTNGTCQQNTGSISLTVNGGTPGYTYLWSNGSTASNLSGVGAGFYSVTVKDANNCVATACGTVTVAGTINASASSEKTCPGGNTGTATALGSNGTAPYTFLWSTGATTQTITGLTAGSYSVTVKDANGCSATATTNVGTYYLSVTCESDPANCNGANTGAARVTYLGFTPASFAWSNGGTGSVITGIPAGVYSVTVTGTNGCSATCSTTVTEPSGVTVTAETNTNASCYATCDGSASASASGGTSPYTYIWSNGATTASVNGLCAGTHTVIVTDNNGCADTAQVTVTEPTELSVTASSTNITCGVGTGSANATATGGTAPVSYQWSNGATTQNISGIAAGTYSVTATDAKGCQATYEVTVTETSGVSASASATNIACYGLSNGTATAIGTGGTGNYTYLWSNGQTSQIIAGLGQGTYTVTITDGLDCSATAEVTVGQPDTLAVACNMTDVVDFGTATGIAAVTVNGGTAPYSFSWNTGATTNPVLNLPAGVYSVTVTDANGCAAEIECSIRQDARAGCDGQRTYTAIGWLLPTQNLYLALNFNNAFPNGLTIGCNNAVTLTNAAQVFAYLPTNAIFLQGQYAAAALAVQFDAYDANYAPSPDPLSAQVALSGPFSGMTVAQILAEANNIIGGCPSNFTYAQAFVALLAINTNYYDGQLTGDYLSCCLPIQVSVTGTNVKCNGETSGSATAVVTGSLDTYTYVWSTGDTTATLTGIGAGSYSVTATNSSGCSASATVTITEAPELNVSAHCSRNVSCFGGNDGMATVTATGGTQPYTYLWSNGATTASVTGLTAGTYTVVVTDANGCKDSTSIGVAEPSALTASAIANGASCSGGATGSVYVTAAGGTPAYTYLWSTGATTDTVKGLGQGTYYVTVTDSKGCKAYAQATVGNPPTLIAITSCIKNALCNGDSTGRITVHVTGGTPAYTYLWSNGATTQTVNNVPAGSYGVTVYDAGNCSATATIGVTEPTAVSVTVTATKVTCAGGATGTATASATGGTPGYTYLWSNGQTGPEATGLVAGNYTVTATDSKGCIATATVCVKQITTIAATATATQITCYGYANGSITATGTAGAGGYTYLWSTGATTQTISNLSPGTYTVTVFDINGCFATAEAAINQPDTLTATASGTNTLCFFGNTGTATVTATGGTAPYTYFWSNGSALQNQNNLAASATYYKVTVTDNKGCTAVDSVLISKPAKVTVSVTPKHITCKGGNDGAAWAVAGGGTPSYTFLWSNGSTNDTITGLSVGNYRVTVTDANGCSATAAISITQPQKLVVSGTCPRSVTCYGGNDGQISAFASGGTPGYTFVWSNGQTGATLTNVAAGNYTVTVTDSRGCQGTATVYVPQPAQIVANAISTPITCGGQNNASASVTATGGTGSYTYLWNTGATTFAIYNLSAGTYSVTVTDAKGCQAADTVVIAPVNTLSVTVCATKPNCFGGNDGYAIATGHGGTSYTYAWSNGQTGPVATGLAAGTYTVTVYEGVCSATASICIGQPPVLNVLVVCHQNVTCVGGNNGAAHVIATGGTPAYTYLWSNGATTSSISGLTAGTYYVTVTDSKGCTGIDTVEVKENPLLTVEATPTNPACYGGKGSASALATGGTSPYFYFWSTGAFATSINNLSAGEYSVTAVDSRGCIDADTIVITEPAQLTASATATCANCYGGGNGTATVSVEGGTAPYSYLWSNDSTTATISGLTAGVYSVTITDANGCVATATATVCQPNPLTVNIFCSRNVTCYGASNGQATVFVYGGTAPYTYLWSNGDTTATATNLPAGTHSVTVTDANGCTAVKSVGVAEPPQLSVEANGTNPLCSDERGSATATANGGTAPYTYAWDNGATTQSITNISVSGPYAVVVTDAKGCTASDTVVIEIPSELDVHIESSSPLCYGDPSAEATAIAVGGTPPYTYAWSNDSTTATIANLEAGTYTVTVFDANRCSAVDVVSVSNPDSLTVACNMTDVVEFGTATGIADVTVNGGTTPYSFAWSTGDTTKVVNNLPAGVYSVTVVDANGCSGTIECSIRQDARVGCEGQVTYSMGGWGAPNSPAHSYLHANFAGAFPAGLTIGCTNILTLTSAQAVTDFLPSGGPSNNLPAGITVDSTSYGNTFAGQLVALTLSTQFDLYDANYAPSADNLINQVVVSGPFSGMTVAQVLAEANNAIGGCGSTFTNAQLQTALAAINLNYHEGELTGDYLACCLPIAVNITPTNPLCYGDSTGSATAIVTGSLDAFTYLWSTGATTASVSGLPAGVYSVTVTNTTGCSASATVTITEHSELEPSAYATNATCYGTATGKVVAEIHGGTAPYTFVWSTGDTTTSISGLVAGTYYVTITDANGCFGVAEADVYEPEQLTADATSTNIACYGGNEGTASVTVGGGTAPYTYIWSNDSTTATLSGLTAATYYVTVYDANQCSAIDTTEITQPELLTAEASSDDVACYGDTTGSVSVTAHGGTPDYTYIWSNGATTATAGGLTAGTYSVTITDANGCVYVTSVTVEQPELLNADATSTNPGCYDGFGTAEATATGGTAPYSFVWSNDSTTAAVTGLTAGTYTVTVTDANGCADTASVTIEIPTAIDITKETSDVNCYNDSTGGADLSVFGGTQPYTFAWSNGTSSEDLEDVPAGTYYVTVTDANGCIAVDSVTFENPELLIVTATATAAGCYGDSTGTAKAFASGGTGSYSYLWSTDANIDSIGGLAAGTYSVTVWDDNRCSASATVEVTQAPLLVVTAHCSRNVSCYGGNDGMINVVATGGTQPYSYLWSNGATTSAIFNLPAGTYSVTVTDANGCSAADTIGVAQPDSVFATAIATPVNCYGGNNGTASVTFDGGTPGYTVLWSNGGTTVTITNLTAGTYTVTVTDSKGCQATAAATVTQPDTLTASAKCCIQHVSCYGGADGSTTVTAHGGTLNYTYLWSNGDTTATIVNLTAGTYTVTVTDANGCTATATSVVKQAPLLITTTVCTRNVSCYGGNNGMAHVTASGGTPGYTYLWSNGATTSIVTNLTAGTYFVTVTDSKGCTAVDTVGVAQPDTLTATATPTNPLCYGGTGSITAQGFGGTAPYTYLWSNGATTATINGLAAGVYTVTVTDAKGCVATATAEIVIPTQIIATTGHTDVSCKNGNDGTAYVSATGGTGSYTYLWSNGSTNDTITGLTAGTYTVTVYDANQCYATGSVTINQPTKVTATASATAVSCYAGNNGTATVIAGGGTPGYTYLWSNGETTATIDTLTAGTYYVTVTDSKGCTAIDTVTVKQPPLLTVTANCNRNALCYGDSTGIAHVAASGGTLPYTYLWSNGATTETVTGLPAGEYSVTVTDANGCSGSATAVVGQPTQLDATATSTNVLCYGGNTGTAEASATGGTAPYTYLWSNGATTASITGLTEGDYTVTVTDAHGCTDSAIVTIYQPEELIATALCTATSCYNSSDAIAFVTVTGGTSPYTYLWSNGQTTDTATGLAGGQFYYVTVTDANGCADTAKVKVRRPALLSASATASPALCYGGNTGSASASVIGGTSPYTFAWSNGATTDTATGLTAGTYAVTITDANGCTAADTVIVTEPTELQASAEGTITLCYGSAGGSATASATGGTAPYTYAWDNGATTASILNLSSGTYYVTVTDANGCTDTASATVVQPDTLTATIESTNALCYGNANGTATVTATGGTGAYTYIWSNGQTTATATGLGIGTYSVSVYDANQCLATAEVTITQPDTLTVACNMTDVVDFGTATGIADVTVAGGTLPYSFVWSTGDTTQTVDSLVAGVYSATVTDANGCSATIICSIRQDARIGCDGQRTYTPLGWIADAQANAYLNANFATAFPTGLTVDCSNATTLTDASSTIAYLLANNSNLQGHYVAAVLATTFDLTDANYASSADNLAAQVALNGPFSGMTVAQILAEANNILGGCASAFTSAQALTAVSSINTNYYDGELTGDFLACCLPIQVSITPTNALCYGDSTGTATAIVTGSLDAYTYLWSTGDTTAVIGGLPAGEYSVTATNTTGCSASATVTIGQPTELEPSAYATNALCYGSNTGLAWAEIHGGTAPYTFVWSTGDTTTSIDSLFAGSYSVTITDANGCSGVAIADVYEPELLTAEASSTPALCYEGNQGTATVTAAGGTEPYAYLWSNDSTTQTIEGLVAGEYTVTITDASGCSTTASTTVERPELLTAEATATAVNCYGGNNGTATVTANGGTLEYSYLWSNDSTTATITGLTAGVYTVTITDTNGCIATATTTVTEPALLTADATGTDVLCYGGNTGSASVTAAGGTAPYTYLWSNGETTAAIDTLTAGTYTVIVTDANQCVAYDTIVVSEPTLLTADAIGSNVSCYGGNNGSATAIANGGTQPYTYLWSNDSTTATINGLTAGTYTVTITDANGCIATATYTVTEPVLLTVDAFGTDVLCYGGNTGSAFATAQGGTAPYTFSWDNGDRTDTITGLIAGTYIVTVFDELGCSATDTVVIGEPTLLTAEATATAVNCYGGNNGTATVTAAGGTIEYTYLWSNDSTTATITGLTAGVYTVTITDANGCIATATTTVTQPELLTADATGTNVLCYGGNTGTASVTANGGTLAYSYLWSNGATTASINGLTEGTYSVIVTDANGCVAYDTVIITQPTLLTANATATAVSCYAGNNGTASVTYGGGTPAYTVLWSNGGTTDTITGLTAGTYSVTITDANGCFVSDTVTVTQPPLLTVTANCNKNVSCYEGSDGIVHVSASGGTLPYTILWSNGATTETVTGLPAGTYYVTVTDANGCSDTASATITEPTLLVATAAGTNALCYGAANGTAYVTYGGGTPAYTVLWSTGATTDTITGLTAGTYTVTVTDANGCLDTASVTITQPDLLVVTAHCTRNVSCFGGADGRATVSIVGGTPAYTILWSNGATTATVTGLTAGTYYVTVTDANGCADTAAVGIAEPTIVIANATATDATCFGGSNGTATVTYSGGTPGYTVLWNTGATTDVITGLAAGTYTVTVTDSHGCSDTASATVSQPTLVTATATGSAVPCYGNQTGTAFVTAAGGTPGYTYLWSNGATTDTITNLGAGTYYVTVTDANGCKAYASATITQPNLLIAVCHNPVNASCFGANDGHATVTVTGGTKPYTYLWSNGDVTATADSLPYGTYFVTVTDANGCTAETAVGIGHPAKLVIFVSGTDIKCYQGNDGTATATVMSGGSGSYTYIWSNGGNTQTITGLTAGSYSVTVIDNATGCQATGQISITTPGQLMLCTSCGSIRNVTCYGDSTGYAKVTATGGVTPYTYLWSNGATTSSINNVPAGTYTVTITDYNGCAITTTVTITQPSQIIATATPTHILCNGGNNGSITTTVSGGAGYYTYNWSNGAHSSGLTNVGAGTYTVTVIDASQCHATAAATITEPALLTVSATATATTCFAGNDGTATANVSGGTTAYSYLWSNGATTSSITGLTAGIYKVTVTDANGCIAIAQTNVSQPAQVSVTVSCGTLTCSNTCVDVTAFGSTSGTYAWSGPSQWTGSGQTVTVCNAGAYTVTFTSSAGCIATATGTVNTNYATPSVQIAPPLVQPVCGSEGNSLTANISGANYYVWTVTSSDNTWSITSSNTTNPVTYTAGSGTQGKFVLIALNTTSGCSAIDSISLNCGGSLFCTMSKGFYSNTGSYCDGRNATQLITDLLGNGPITIGSGANTVTFFQSDAVCLQGKLGGGPSGPLGGSYTCNTLNVSNSLIAQTIAMSLNLELSPTLGNLTIQNNCFSTLKSSDCGNPTATPVSGTFESHCIPSSIRTYFGGNYTVNQLVNLANLNLGGQAPVNSPSYSDITAALDALVKGFDECRFVTEWTATEVSDYATGITEVGNKGGVTFSMFPNPADAAVNVRFTSEQAGEAQVRIFDMNGKVVTDVFGGNVDANVTYQVDVNTVNLEKAVYVVQVTCNKQTTNARLVVTH